MKVILDTNVLVSGIFFTGTPHRILKAWESGQFRLIVTKEILQEYTLVIEEMSRKKPGFDPTAIFAYLNKKVVRVEPVKLPHQVCTDKDDDKFIACAVHAKAIIVSGDKALLKASGYEKIQVLTPAEFERKYLI